MRAAQEIKSLLLVPERFGVDEPRTLPWDANELGEVLRTYVLLAWQLRALHDDMQFLPFVRGKLTFPFHDLGMHRVDLGLRRTSSGVQNQRAHALRNFA